MRTVVTSGLALLFCLAACLREGAPPSTAVSPPVTKLPDSCRELSCDEAEALMKAKPDLVILDMRVESEWVEEGHLPNAQRTNFYREALKEHLAAMDRSKPYLVCCAIGERSRQTVAQMGELGFRELYLLSGGMNAWKASGRPVAK